MAKKVNRKKQLKKQLATLRKAGQDLAGVAAQKAHDVADNIVEATGKAVESVTERVQETVEKATKKGEETKKDVAKTAAKAEKIVKKAAQDFEGFAAELEGVAAARLETFYEEGITSTKDFAKFTEKELLALKGIGPATIKQLKELGVKLKK